MPQRKSWTKYVQSQLDAVACARFTILNHLNVKRRRNVYTECEDIQYVFSPLFAQDCTFQGFGRVLFKRALQDVIHCHKKLGAHTVIHTPSKGEEGFTLRRGVCNSHFLDVHTRDRGL